MTATSSNSSNRRLQVVALVDAKPGHEEALRALLEALVAPTRSEDGCVLYDLHQDLDSPGSFVFFEIWESAEDLDRHSQSDHLAHFRQEGPALWKAPPRVIRMTQIA